MSTPKPDQEKVTVPGLRAMKEAGEKIAMLTAYDYPTALLVDRAGIEVILVGDSVANNALGYEDTLPVTLEEMLHHTRAVSRAVRRALVVGDLPFMSYQVSPRQAIESGGRFMKEAGAAAVKLEGGEEMAETVAAMVRVGIPVMGHIGLTPQRVSQMGGFRVQGREEAQARRLLRDARALEEAGAFSLILEAVPWALARAITERVSVPTIGIGAGPHCDGQVLVIHDLLGLSFRLAPKFAKRYADLDRVIEEALQAYKREVKQGAFPTVEAHSFAMDEGVLQRVLGEAEAEGD